MLNPERAQAALNSPTIPRAQGRPIIHDSRLFEAFDDLDEKLGASTQITGPPASFQVRDAGPGSSHGGQGKTALQAQVGHADCALHPAREVPVEPKAELPSFSALLSRVQESKCIDERIQNARMLMQAVHPNITEKERDATRDIVWDLSESDYRLVS